jgi:hypothetical protein
MGRTAGAAAPRRQALGIRDRCSRDQRKRIIKMCIQKLRDIDDPETVLCRAVLINNTFRTLKTAQRALLRSARRRVADRRNSSEEEAEGAEVEPVELVEEPQVALRQEPVATFSPGELDDLPGCANLGCSDPALVHSLVMPPLLSPHIEDMTNCSFYDTFGPVQLGQTGAEQDTTAFSDSDNVPANLKLTMMKSDLCDVITESNSNTQQQQHAPYYSKTEFATCGGAGGEGGDSLLDTLLTEIGQA